MIDFLRKTIRFGLATFLWLHAAFALDIPTGLFGRLGSSAHLTEVETILFVMLLVFSFIAGRGFWQGVGNIAYVYFFPFVLAFHVAVGFFYIFRAFARLTNPKPALAAAPTLIVTPDPALVQASSKDLKRDLFRQIGEIISRPFTRFTILWCLLLLTTTKGWLLAICLAVVAVHLVRKIIFVLKISLFSGDWFDEAVKFLQKTADEWIVKLQMITPESSSVPDLMGLWSTLRGVDRILSFLQDEKLLSKWALFLVSILFGIVYIYLAFLFSFVYYGIAHVVGIYTVSWSNFLVMSLFMPFYVSALPPSALIRLFAGLQCSLALVIGIGSILKYVRGKIRSISVMATTINVRLSDETIREKRTILEEKFKKPAK